MKKESLPLSPPAVLTGKTDVLLDTSGQAFHRFAARAAISWMKALEGTTFPSSSRETYRSIGNQGVRSGSCTSSARAG